MEANFFISSKFLSTFEQISFFCYLHIIFKIYDIMYIFVVFANSFATLLLPCIDLFKKNISTFKKEELMMPKRVHTFWQNLHNVLNLCKLNVSYSYVHHKVRRKQNNLHIYRAFNNNQFQRVWFLVVVVCIPLN